MQCFVSCVLRFYFSLPLIFTLMATRISHCLTATLKFHVFLPTKFVSFAFNHSLLLFLSNNVEKDTTLFLFFLSKSPGSHAISFQIKPWVAVWLPYLLIELFYIGMPVVQTASRAVGWCRSHDYQIFSDTYIHTYFIASLPLGGSSAIHTRIKINKIS